MIYSYDVNSESARLLAQVLGVSLIKHKDSTFRGGLNKTVINWGCSDLPVQVRRSNVLNQETAVYNTVNKLRAFPIMQRAGVQTVPFTFDQEEAIRWSAAGNRVAVRSRVAGKDGEGLSLIPAGGTIPAAKLYTKFITAEKEYRITVARTRGGEYQVVARQRKVRLDEVPPNGYNDEIKTSSSGYGFKWVVRNIPEPVEQAAVQATQALGLDFCGVDVIWDGTQEWVLEGNTAPELTPNSSRALGAVLRERLRG